VLTAMYPVTSRQVKQKSGPANRATPVQNAKHRQTIGTRARSSRFKAKRKISAIPNALAKRTIVRGANGGFVISAQDPKRPIANCRYNPDRPSDGQQPSLSSNATQAAVNTASGKSGRNCNMP